MRERQGNLTGCSSNSFFRFVLGRGPFRGRGQEPWDCTLGAFQTPAMDLDFGRWQIRNIRADDIEDLARYANNPWMFS